MFFLCFGELVEQTRHTRTMRETAHVRSEISEPVTTGWQWASYPLLVGLACGGVGVAMPGFPPIWLIGRQRKIWVNIAKGRVGMCVG